MRRRTTFQGDNDLLPSLKWGRFRETKRFLSAARSQSSCHGNNRQRVVNRPNTSSNLGFDHAFQLASYLLRSSGRKVGAPRLGSAAFEPRVAVFKVAGVLHAVLVVVLVLFFAAFSYSRFAGTAGHKTKKMIKE